VGGWRQQTRPGFSDFLISFTSGSVRLRDGFTGTTVLRVENGKIAEKVGLDDRATALRQLGLLKAA